MDVRKNMLERIKQAEDEAAKLRAALGAYDGKSAPARKRGVAARRKMSAAQKQRRARERAG